MSEVVLTYSESGLKILRLKNLCRDTFRVAGWYWCRFFDVLSLEPNYAKAISVFHFSLLKSTKCEIERGYSNQNAVYKRMGKNLVFFFFFLEIFLSPKMLGTYFYFILVVFFCPVVIRKSCIMFQFCHKKL